MIRVNPQPEVLPARASPPRFLYQAVGKRPTKPSLCTQFGVAMDATLLRDHDCSGISRRKRKDNIHEADQ